MKNTNETEQSSKALLQAKHRLEEVQSRNRVKAQKARAHRLIQEGAILRSIHPQIREMSLETLDTFLRGLHN